MTAQGFGSGKPAVLAAIAYIAKKNPEAAPVVIKAAQEKAAVTA
jgi:hypothetical protein